MSASSPSPFKGGGFAKTLDLYALCDISELRSNEPVACEIGFEDGVLGEANLSPYLPPFILKKRIWRYRAVVENEKALSLLKYPMLLRPIGFEDESFARDTERWGFMRFYEKHCRRIIAKALVP